MVFDLDDTLYDCTGSLVEASRRRASEAMVAAGLPLTTAQADELQKELAESKGPYFLVFDEIARRYGMDREFIEKAYRAYNSDEVSDIRPFDDTIPALREMRTEGVRSFLMTTGIYDRQARKVELLGLAPHFDDVLINDMERGSLMVECFRHLMDKYRLRPDQVAVVGDRAQAELRTAKELGMTTFQMMHGRFRNYPPRDDKERPDYKINRLFQIPTLLRLANMGKGPDNLRILAVGGGTGLPIVLQGCKTYSHNLTAVVTVTDSGRSSGTLREEFGILPPGDARNCLVALSETEEQERDLYELFQYRFSKGTYKGMSLGNLLIAAMAEKTGSFEQAIKKLSRLLNIRGKVLPSTLTDTHICAELEDGSEVEGEVNVRGLNKPPIKRVFLKPENAEPTEEALAEIERADIIVLGPGSLFTSVITNLLVKDVTRAIVRSDAIKIYICNVVTQPGQTDNFSAADHVRQVIRYLGEGVLDYVLINHSAPRAGVLKRYEEEGAKLATVTDELYRLGVKVLQSDLVEDIDVTRVLWEKQDLLRHHPDKLADSICRVYSRLPLITA